MGEEESQILVSLERASALPAPLHPQASGWALLDALGSANAAGPLF